MALKQNLTSFVMSETQTVSRRLARDVGRNVRASTNMILDVRRAGIPPLPIPIDKNARSTTNETLRVVPVPSLNIANIGLEELPRRNRSESNPAKPTLPLLPRKRKLSNSGVDEPTKVFIDMAKRIFENRTRTYFEKKKEIDPMEEFRKTPLPPFPLEEEA